MLNWVEVFTTCGHSWKTSVSSQTTKEDAEKYFVGQMFNIGVFPEEKMAKVARIEFHQGEE